MSQTGSSQSQTVYIQLNQITELRRRDVFLKDVGEVTCRDKVILSKCRALKVKSIPEKEARRYVMSALEVVRMLEALDPSIEVNNLGESDFIIAYKPPKASEVCWQWIKTVFVCLVSFFGAAFATVLSQAISGVLCLIYIMKKITLLHITRDDLQLSRQYVKNLIIK